MAERKDNVIERVMQVIGKGQEDLLRRIVEIFLQKVLEAEMTEHIGAEKYERTSQRKGHRNGYKPRTFITRVGTIHLQVPQDREGEFHTEIFERYQSMDKALVLGIMEMYVNGVSTRKVRNITEELCGKSISKSTVSRLTQDLDESLEEWRNRHLEEAYPVLYVDAQFHKVREGGRVISKAVMTTAGVRESDGRREILSIETKEGETQQSWLSVFEGLKERGLRGVRIVVSDAHKGLVSAIEQAFTGVLWQRCQAHFMRNAMDVTPGKYKSDVSERLNRIFNSADKKEALEHKKEIVKQYENKATKLADFIDENIEDCLAVYEMPEQWRKRVRTTNMLERYHSEVRRRTRVVRIFPNEASLLRLASAVGRDCSDEWISSPMPYLPLVKSEASKPIEEVNAQAGRCVS
jgi:putative transposase